MLYRILAFLLLFLALFLNLKPIDSSPLIRLGKTIVFYAIFPFEKGMSLGVGGLKNTASFFVYTYSAQKKIQDLDQKLKQAESETALLQSLKDENKNFREALRFSQTNPYSFKLTPALVIGRDSKTWNSVILIDCGTEKGARPGLSVISEKGLVGRIIESSRYASKVLLITSPQSAVSVAVHSGNTLFGIARGGRGSNLSLEYIPETVSVEASSRVVVSNASYAFIPGIPVGNVLRVEKSLENIFQKIEVNPSAKLSYLGVVFVCKPY